MEFRLGEYGEAFIKRPTPQRTNPNEQFKHNILKQRDLFLGKTVLAGEKGTPLPATFTVIGDTVEYGLKFGGAYVKLDGERTHYKWPKDTFADYLLWLSERAEEGEFAIQLNAISANIRTRLTKKKVVEEEAHG